MTTEGFLLIDKPAGITSHDVIDQLRRITGIRKIGHAGTLDPFATGLLIRGVGRTATQRLGELIKKDKEYLATIQFGTATDSHDLTGDITQSCTKIPSEEEIKNILASFLGTQLQTPPMFSAKKVQGKKLYELARAGQTIERTPVEITIHTIELTAYTPVSENTKASARIRIFCSSGTYIRVLGSDIATKLGSCGHLTQLQRTKIDQYKLENATSLEKLSAENWQLMLIDLVP